MIFAHYLSTHNLRLLRSLGDQSLAGDQLRQVPMACRPPAEEITPSHLIYHTGENTSPLQTWEPELHVDRAQYLVPSCPSTYNTSLDT